MNEKLRARLDALYELIERGATEGERQAAKNALDRIIKKHKIDPREGCKKTWYAFPYTWMLELELLCHILRKMTPTARMFGRYPPARKCIVIMQYEDYVVASCAYAYFRRHMRAQWKKVCAPKLKRFRNAKNRDKRKAVLEGHFLPTYIIMSGLFLTGEIRLRDVKDDQEKKDLQLMLEVEGGKYHTQVPGAKKETKLIGR